MTIGSSSLTDLARLRSFERHRLSSWDRTGGNADFIRIAPGETADLGQIEGPVGRILEARLDDGSANTGRIQSNDSATDDMADGTAPGAATYDDDTRYDMAFRL